MSTPGAYAKTLSWYLAIMSGLALIGHAVFQTVMAVSSDYGRELLPDNATSTEVVEFLGFHRYVALLRFMCQHENFSFDFVFIYKFEVS
jgi:hypothetical protein